MADRVKVSRYKPFPKHEDFGNKSDPGVRHYHSSSLPLPNVVRIEIMSPIAKARYLGKFHSMMDGFRQELTNSIMTEDATQPFYGFFDPAQNGDIGFDVSATWTKDTTMTLDGMAKQLKNLPVVGKAAGWAADKVAKVASIGDTITGAMGMDNNSTGACTIKAFQDASFRFNKTVKCSWYMPEMEAQARVSISRLMKMAYVRNFDLNDRGDYGKKVAEALRAITTNINSFEDKQSNNGSGGSVFNTIVGGAADFMATGVEKVTEIGGGAIDGLINGAIDLNAFFGGSLTMTPVPVRLTMGHILDIEPLVITNVHITGSKEQFMTDDGTNIPLFVNAEIQFDMWMTPDPNKGFVQWLGDDVFNIGYTVGESADVSDGRSKNTEGNNMETKNGTRSSKTGKVVGKDTAKADPALRKGGK